MPTPPAAVEAATPARTTAETVLALLALAAGGISSLLLVAASAGWAPMPVLFWAVCVPGMAMVAAVLGYARHAGMRRLEHQLWIAVGGGITLTLALDAVRSAGVHLGYLTDSVTMFGNLITAAPPTARPTPASYTLGAVYHLFNGISFALVYSLLFGRSRWWGPVLFSVLVVWIGMMTLPPMAAMLGPFGAAKYGTVFNGFALDTLAAHLAMGLALGLITQRFARHPGLLTDLLARHRPATQPA